MVSRGEAARAAVGMAGQDVLDLGKVERTVGRVERAFLESIGEARRRGEIDGLDAGLAGLAVELARACDVAGRKNDPYGVATAGRELREVAGRLRLDPTARGTTGDDSLTDLLRDLNTPTAVRHGEDP